MPNNTPNLGLYKKNPATDGNDSFDIQTMLNDNWDKIDAVISTDDDKQSVRVSTTSNITLSATQTVDGVVLVVGDRVLVKNQNIGSQNGIYIVSTGSWTRSTDTDTSAEVTSGMMVRVNEGTNNSGSEWFLSTPNPITLGTTSLTFTQADGPFTINDSTTAVNTPSRFGTILSMLGNMIKSITGKSNWFTLPSTTLEAANTHMNNTSNPHGVTALQVGAPAKTTADTTYYVNTATGNDSNNGTTSGTAFKTIAKAISMIPQIVNHVVTINVSAGTYSEVVSISGFSGAGSILINASTVTSVQQVKVYNCSIRVELDNITATTTTDNGFDLEYNTWVYLNTCSCTSNDLSHAGVYNYGSTVVVANGTFSNRSDGIMTRSAGRTYLVSNSGTGNTNGITAKEGGYAGGAGAQPTGTNPQVTSGGGCISINSGVINPWGDNTQSTRSRVFAGNNATQAISPSTNTKILYQNTGLDNLTEWANSKFTAKAAGVYDVKGTINFSAGVTSAAFINITLYKNGAVYKFARVDSGANTPTPLYNFALTVDCNAGDYLEVYISSTAAVTIGNTYVYLDITRIA